MANKVVYTFEDSNSEALLLGAMNKNIQIIEDSLKCKIMLTRNQLLVDEEFEEVILKIFRIIKLFNTLGNAIKEKDLISIISMVKNYSIEEVEAFYQKTLVFVNTYDGRPITAKTINQKRYFEALQNNDIIFGTGVAGSGKTFLAVAYALNQLKKNKIKKIIITRPVVEAGEKLGFLPGDLKEKIDPYLIPIYDAINEILGVEQASKLIEKQVIEIAPLAYMRGRTLDNAFIILDEAQNTTRNQMKMFLTRLGFNSKMVITGDVTQIDLPHKNMSGLIEATTILKDEKEIAIIKFEKDDVMRHPLVSKIIEKYEAVEND